MYIYKAKIVRVIDGDTFEAIVDVGFSIKIKHIFRVHNFDAPESWRPKTEEERVHGDAAKEFAIGLLDQKDVVIETYKLEIYNRYSCDVTMPDGQDFATVMTESGYAKII